VNVETETTITDENLFSTKNCQSHQTINQMGEWNIDIFQTLKIHPLKAGMVIHTSNVSTWEAKAGGSKVQACPGLHSKTLSLKSSKTGGVV
jgi:hypothetical protein